MQRRAGLGQNYPGASRRPEIDLLACPQDLIDHPQPSPREIAWRNQICHFEDDIALGTDRGQEGSFRVEGGFRRVYHHRVIPTGRMRLMGTSCE